ncbi:MAG TPA: c-type cytochrome [Opitutaceae bacterium]|nr:c-type cytochrome [Opitutaceae bacterium]
MTKPTIPPNAEPHLRPHRFDGIQEFDQRLPNWWLFTLYGAIIFWIGSWSYYQWFREGKDGPQQVQAALTQIEATKLAATAAARIDDAGLWAMSRNPVIVEQGRQVFEANCIPCHLSSLRGKSESPAAIGPDLTDRTWIHGGRPTDAYRTVTQGVPEKGMPTWGPILGARRISQAVAYVYSHHQEGEPIQAAPPP